MYLIVIQNTSRKKTRNLEGYEKEWSRFLVTLNLLKLFWVSEDVIWTRNLLIVAVIKGKALRGRIIKAIKCDPCYVSRNEGEHCSAEVPT